MNEDIDIVFKVSEINEILTALGKIPAEQSMNLIIAIKTKTEQQIKESENTPEVIPDESVSDAEEVVK